MNDDDLTNTLFDPPPFQAHSETSIEAASEIEPNAGTLRRRVLDFIRATTAGATDDEVQVALEMNPSTQRPRRIELWRAGFVENSGFKRKTRAGRSASVWVASRPANAPR